MMKLLSASNPDDFALKVKGIQSTSDLTMEEDERKKAVSRETTSKPKPGVAREYKSTSEAREYTGPTGDSDFKIDRFGDK